MLLIKENARPIPFLIRGPQPLALTVRLNGNRLTKQYASFHDYNIFSAHATEEKVNYNFD
jgi:hypothetical protein